MNADESIRPDIGSYRDRAGRVLTGPRGEIFRGLSNDALVQWQQVANSPFAQRAMAEGRLVATREMSPTECEQTGLAAEEVCGGIPWAGFVRHDRIPFVSYPYEWTWGMLRDAALSQLDLLREAFDSGFTLKDGTLYNTQWRGTSPVFIDTVSLERWTPGLPWMGYRQFCQTGLFPLWLQSFWQCPFHPWLRGRLDGIAPDEFNALCGWRDLFRRGVLVHGWLHARLQQSRPVADQDVRGALERRGLPAAAVRNSLNALRKVVARLSWAPTRSTWSDYAPAYSTADWQAKQQFVRRAVETGTPGMVWDLGCNTGDFARIAAETAPVVVALDGDHAAVEQLYRALRRESGSTAAQRILPLVGNVCDPSPNQGWLGAERRSWPNRGRPDLVLALALVHHLVLGAGIPLEQLLDWLHSLGGAVVLEFVDKSDPQARRVLHNRRDDDSGYSLEACEAGLRKRFGRCERLTLSDGGRTLFHALPR